MMNTLTQSDLRAILRSLDAVKELTDLLRRAHYDVDYKTVYNAAGAEANIREKILSVALADVAVEPGPRPISEVIAPIKQEAIHA
jgi:hypothetical protein